MSTVLRRAAGVLAALRVRRRPGLPVLVCSGAALVVAAVFRDLPLDMNAFARWGGQLLRGHLGAVYAQSADQAGPLQLIASRVLMLGGRQGSPLRAVVVLSDLVLVVLAIRAARTDTGDPVRQNRRELLVGGAAVLWLVQVGPWSGHPAELAIPVLWAAGLRWLRRARTRRAALAFGLAVAVAPWAILVLPATLAVARLRTATAVSVAAAGLGAALYLPFAATGHFQLFAYRWPIRSGTLISYLAPHLTELTWPLRVVQAVIVAGGTALVAVQLRGHRSAVTLAPIVTVLLRVLTDPQKFSYYWLPVAVLAILTLAQSPITGSRLGTDLRLLALVYVPWAATSLPAPVLGVTAMLLLVGWLARRDAPDPNCAARGELVTQSVPAAGLGA